MDERDGTVTLEWSRRFVWREPDLDALRTVVRAQLQEPRQVWARIDLGGAPRKELSFNSLHGWLDALRSDAELLHVHADMSVFAVDLDADPMHRKLSVRVTAGEAAVARVEALITELQQALVLEQWAGDLRSSVIGRYALERPEVGWVQQTLTLAFQFPAPIDQFHGRYRRQEDAHHEREISDLAAWMAIVTGSESLISWRATAWGPGRSIDLDWSADRGELIVRAEAADAEAATRSLGELERLRGLKPRDSESWSRRRGSKRTYLVRSRPDPSWIKRLLAELQRASGSSTGFEGRLRTREDREFTFNELNAWSQKVDAVFGDAIWLYVSFNGRGGAVTAALDLQRDVLDLELRSSNLDPETALVQLAGMFELEAVSGNPHRYRRFGSVYKIDRWPGNEKYATVVKQAIEIAFGDRLPAIAEAVVTQPRGHGQEELQPFYAMDKFLDRLRNAEEYFRASIVVQGPLGHHLGIHFNREKDELRLYANLSRPQFRSVDALFGEQIDLTLKKKENAEGNASTPQRFTIMVPAITAILVAFVTSFFTQVFPLARASPRLEITWPGKPLDGKPLAIPRGAIKLAWRYVSPRPLGDRLDYQLKASVFIVQQGATPWQWETEASGETTIPMPPPGNFHVRVHAVDSSAEDNLDLLVQ